LQLHVGLESCGGVAAAGKTSGEIEAEIVGRRQIKIGGRDREKGGSFATTPPTPLFMIKKSASDRQPLYGEQVWYF
jgi:hypothetical protein